MLSLSRVKSELSLRPVKAMFFVDVLARRPRLRPLFWSPSRDLGLSHLRPFPRDESLFPRRVARPRDATSKLPTFLHVSLREFNYCFVEFYSSDPPTVLISARLSFVSFGQFLR